MNLIGKTIARIEERPTHPQYGDDTLILHFTDGTAMEVVGSSYEDVSLDWRELTSEDARRYAASAQGRREAERLTRLRREEWDALPAEEKASREAARRAKLTPFARAMEDATRDMTRSMAADLNRSVFGSTLTIPKAPKRPKARRT